MRHLVALPLVVFLLAGCAARPARSPDETNTAQAPNFTLRGLDGKIFRVSDHLGKDVVMLSFWATWCLPCLGELPELEKLHQKYRDQGLRMIAVSMDGPETIANVESTIRRLGVTFPVLLDEDTRVAAVYNPTRDAPYAVIIDRTGSIADRRLGYAPGDEAKLEEKLRSLLFPGTATDAGSPETPATSESAQ